MASAILSWLRVTGPQAESLADQVARLFGPSSDPMFRSFIRSQPEQVELCGECPGALPLLEILELSARHPGLLFNMTGYGVNNGQHQRWHFEGGRGRLWECADNGPPAERCKTETTYAWDGVVSEALPSWVVSADLQAAGIQTDHQQDQGASHVA